MLDTPQWQGSRKCQARKRSKKKKKIQLDISFLNFIKDTERNVKDAIGRKPLSTERKK